MNTVSAPRKLLKSFHGKLRCPICGGPNGIWAIKLDYLAVTGTELTTVKRCRNCHIRVLYKTKQTQKPRYEKVYGPTGLIESRMVEPGRVAILAEFNRDGKRDLARMFGVSLADVQEAIDEAAEEVYAPEADENALRAPKLPRFNSDKPDDLESAEQQGVAEGTDV